MERERGGSGERGRDRGIERERERDRERDRERGSEGEREREREGERGRERGRDQGMEPTRNTTVGHIQDRILEETPGKEVRNENEAWWWNEN